MKANSKKNVIPDFKYTPEPPGPAKRTVEESIKVITELLKSHSPEEQNIVLAEVLVQSVESRYNEYETARKNEKIAGENFEKLMTFSKDIDAELKKSIELKEKRNA